MNPYDRYPGIDSEHNFPQEVREALANSFEIKNSTSGQIDESLGEYDQGLRDDLNDYRKIDTVAPGRPQKPILSLSFGAVLIRATGKEYADGRDMPSDFSHYNSEVDNKDGLGFVPEGASIGHVAGSSELYGKPAGEISVRLIAVDTSGNASDPGESETITVVPIETAEEVRTDYEAAQKRVDESLETFSGTVNQAVEKAESAEEAATAAEARATEANNRAMSRLANGNFEDGLKYWKTVAGASLTTDAHSGSQAVILNPGGRIIPESSMPVVFDQEWELQLYFKPTGIPSGSGLLVQFAKPGEEDTGPFLMEAYVTGGPENWHASGAIRVKIPADVDQLSFRAVNPWAETTSFVVDDFSLRDVTDVVRLENAANAARQKAEAAEARAIAVELVQGGIDDRLAENERILTEAGVEGATQLATLDQRLTNAFQTADTAVRDHADALAKDAVHSTLIEYAVGSETVVPTSGWSATTPSRTPGSYIWMRTTITYGDLSTTVLAPALLTGNDGAQGPKGDMGSQGIQGIQGPKGDQGLRGPDGADGTPSYTHIAYANNATGTSGFSTSDSNRTYIGIATSSNPTDPATPESYNWSLIKGADGTQGVAGPAGADGKTPYLHIAYATNSSGTAGFSTTVSTGKTYIGQYTDFTAADSTTPSLYSWTLIKGADGAKGDTGAQGIQGIQGPKGDQGLRGPDGADGTPSYTHIAYANNATGTSGFSTSDPNRTYIGIATSSNPTDPTTPESYNWSLIKGADGSQGVAGPAGADGKTPYLHIAYATNSTGTTGFSTTVSTGKTYIGQYTDFTSADSSTPSMYSWTLIKGADGSDGAKGDTGAQGVSITSVTPYYRVLPQTTAQPAKPTTMTPSGWSTTEPSYAPDTKLWKTERIVYSNGTFAYTDVSQSSAYAAADAVKIAAAADAQTKLDQARAEIDKGLNLIQNTAKSGKIDRWSQTSGIHTVESIDFFGTPVDVHKVLSSGNTLVMADRFPVDLSKAYEVRFWYKDPLQAAGTISSQFYFGLYAYNKIGSATKPIRTVDRRLGIVTTNANPYWYYTSGPTNEWKELVGYILPYGTDPKLAQTVGNTLFTMVLEPEVESVGVRWLNYFNSGTNRSVFVTHQSVTETTVDAIARAAEAKAVADAAHTAAGNAQSTANAAVTSANGKNAVMRSTSSPSGDGKVVGDVWWQFKTDAYTEVIGQWSWSGSGWTKSQHSHQMIASVDLATLTVVGTSKLTDVVSKQIYSDLVVANDVFARRMVVTDGSNLVPNPRMDDGGIGWSPFGTGATSSEYEAGVQNGKGLLIYGRGESTGYRSEKFRVTPGVEYYFSYYNYYALTGTAPTPYVRIYWLKEDGTAVTSTPTYNDFGTTTTGVREVKVTPPAGATRAYVSPFAHTGSTGGYMIISDFKMFEKLKTVQIADGAVRGANIVADESMTTKIFGAETGVIQYLTATNKALFLAGLDAIGESWIDGVNIKNKAITAALMNFIKEGSTNRLRLDENGLLLERISGNRAILRLDENGLKGFDPRVTTTVPTFSLDPLTGKVTAIGMEAVDINATGNLSYKKNAAEMGIRDGLYGPGLYGKVDGLDVGGIATGPDGIAMQSSMVGVQYPSTVAVTKNWVDLYSSVGLTDESSSLRLNTAGAATLHSRSGDVELRAGYDKQVMAGSGNTLRPVATTGPWKFLNKVNGWVNVTGRPPARYRIVGDEIHFSGAAVGGTNGYLGTIPLAEDCPYYTLDTSITKVASQDIARLTVYPDGRVVSNTLTGGSGTYLSFDGGIIALDRELKNP